MKNTHLKIEIIKIDSDEPVNISEYDNVICVDDSTYSVAKLELSGKHCKTYTVIGFFIALDNKTVLVDGDRLFICLFDKIIAVDLISDAIIKVIDYEAYQLFGIFKFKGGYFIRGEGSNMFLNYNLDRVWEFWCDDIFANPYLNFKKSFKIRKNYVAAYDWYGYRHFYNENGEFKIEYHQKYDGR